MKIGILTQPLKTNYGGLLQNYALQQVLIRAGHTPITIDQGEKIFPKWYVLLSRIKWEVLHLLFPTKYAKPVYQYIPSDKELEYISQNCTYFVDKYILHTSKCMKPEDFSICAEKNNINAFVVGSDQCWRPSYNSFLPEMFLDFVVDNHIKRIAYAASFGTDKWEFTPKENIICSVLARKFNLVTVREDSGVSLCKEHLGVEATHVLDPTMLLTKEDYVHLVEIENEPKVDGALLCYILNPDDKKTKFINEVADKMHLKPYITLQKYQKETRTKNDVKLHIDDCVYPKVTTWLRAFMDAEMTIVDSFHGVVFSILFNKPFWAIGNEKRGMSRFTSLLKLFGLEDRLLDVTKLDNIDCTRPIEWNRINIIIERERIKSRDLLVNSLN